MAYLTDHDLERERILRRRKIAEAQLAQSMQPMGGTETVGGVAVRRSPFEGVAKVAQAYSAHSDLQDFDRQEREIAERRLGDTQNALTEYQRKISPRAAVAGALTEDASGNAFKTDDQPAYNPTPQDKQGAAYGLLAKLGGDPRETAKLVVAQALKDPSSMVGKVEPKDYTPESFAQFMTTGNAAVLRPRVKAELFGDTAVDPYSVKPGDKFRKPEASPEVVKLMRERDALPQGDPRRATLDAAITKATTHSPGTTVNVSQSTEKKFGEMFAGKVADQDVGLLDAARKAPELASRANSIKEVLATGKVITGAGADYRLALGKALNLVGASDDETIKNTEVLSVSLARNTLDAIKASGLGSGTGFSNADRDFLEKAAGGKINLEAGTIGKLADLSHRAADLSAQAWNKRVKDIPDSALQGTGIKRDPITVSPLHGAKGKPQISPETQRLLDKYAPEGR